MNNCGSTESKISSMAMRLAGARYQIEGKYIEEHKAFIFDLNEYKELPLFKIEKNKD